MKKDLRSTTSLMIVLMASIMITFVMYANEVNAASEPGMTQPISARASAERNSIYWINPGATYRSGATLQFYATGDGYGPEEPQGSDPAISALRVGTTTITAKAPVFGQYRAFSKSIKIRVVPKMVNIKTLRSSKALNHTIKKLIPGKKYSISVRSYKKIGNTTYSGYYTSWKKVQVK